MADGRFSDIAVCVATRDRPEGLTRLLESLCRSTPPPIPVRIVVIDNSERPTSAEVVESFGDRLSIEWHHESRIGIPFARNAALDHLADDELMACTDDDCEVDPSWLAAMYSTLCTHGADAVGGVSIFVPPIESPRWLFEVGFQRPPVQEGERALYLSTANALMSVRALRDRGLRFDERFPLLGGEDSWLSNQLATSGATIVRSASAIVREHLPVSRMSVRWLVRRHFRYGYGASLRRLRARPARAVVTEVARVVFRTAVGAVRVVGALCGGRRWLLRGLLRLAAAGGSLWALLGGRFADYRRTDGR